MASLIAMASEDDANAEIDLTLGRLRFSASGPPSWLADQLGVVLEAAAELVQGPEDVEKPTEDVPDATGGNADPSFTTTLASHIKANNGESNQVQRFLATADWLRRRGKAPLTTAKVSGALRDGHQKRLSNPSDALNKNVSKGFCEKTSDGFFVTPDGLGSLGST